MMFTGLKVTPFPVITCMASFGPDAAITKAEITRVRDIIKTSSFFKKITVLLYARVYFIITKIFFFVLHSATEFTYFPL